MEVKRISKRNLGRDDRFVLVLIIHAYCKQGSFSVECREQFWDCQLLSSVTG